MSLSPPLAAIIIRSVSDVSRKGVPSAGEFLLIENVKETATRTQSRIAGVSGITAQITEGDFVFSVAVSGFAKMRRGIVNEHPGKALDSNCLDWFFLKDSDSHFGYKPASGHVFLYHSPSWGHRPGRFPDVSFIVDVEFSNPPPNPNPNVDTVGDVVVVNPPEEPPDTPVTTLFTAFWHQFVGAENPPSRGGMFQFVMATDDDTTTSDVLDSIGFSGPSGSKASGSAQKWHPGDAANPAVGDGGGGLLYISAIWNHVTMEWFYQSEAELSPIHTGLPQYPRTTNPEVQRAYVVWPFSKTSPPNNVGTPEIWVGDWSYDELLITLGLSGPADLTPADYDSSKVKALFSYTDFAPPLGGHSRDEFTQFRPGQEEAWKIPADPLALFTVS